MSKYIAVLLILISLAASSVSAQFVAVDPSKNAFNARTLGMGKSAVALSGDTSAIYTNPAGLAGIEKWQISSMSGRFLNHYNYLSFAGVYQTNLGQIGFGFAGTSIGGAYATQVKTGSLADDPVYEIDPTKTTMQNYNNVYTISYGTNLGRFLKDRFSWSENVALGASFKTFSTGISGADIADGAGSGNELDLGMQITPKPWLTLGSVVQNALPASMGGRLKYASGHEESYPATAKLGLRLNLLGQENSLKKLNDQDLVLLVDYDLQPSVSNYPGTCHIGLEWQPIEFAALRLGINQEALSNGLGSNLKTVNSLSAGFGFYANNFRFDYAYTQSAAAPGLDNNYFSISYGIFDRQNTAKKESVEEIVVNSPQDKAMVFDERIAFTGKRLGSQAHYLRANQAGAEIASDGNFEVVVPLEVGKNLVTINAYDPKGKFVASISRPVLRLKTFQDVSQDLEASIPISLVAMQNIVTGYPDGSFKPQGKITRAEMCTLLIKALPGKENLSSTSFNDVSASHWAAAYISQASELGIVKGYPGNVFKPSADISREEGIAMIARFAKIIQQPYYSYFDDVAQSSWSAEIIAGAYNAGILDHIRNKPLRPKEELTRAEAVEIIYRTSVVRNILAADLLNWDSYYAENPQNLPAKVGEKAQEKNISQFDGIFLPVSDSGETKAPEEKPVSKRNIQTGVKTSDLQSQLIPSLPNPQII